MYVRLDNQSSWCGLLAYCFWQGTPTSNTIVADFLSTPGLPFGWNSDASLVQVGAREFKGGSIVPQLIYPSPFGAGRYVVLNSGTTFREGHDNTNSMQNAKLPDWCVVDITVPADDKAPGFVLADGFCDESWVPIV